MYDSVYLFNTYAQCTFIIAINLVLLSNIQMRTVEELFNIWTYAVTTVACYDKHIMHI